MIPRIDEVGRVAVLHLDDAREQRFVGFRIARRDARNSGARIADERQVIILQNSLERFSGSHILETNADRRLIGRGEARIELKIKVRLAREVADGVRQWHFIDHDEWGVALDWILTEITESGAPVPRGIVDELTSMAPLMYPGKDLSERLRRLSLLADDTES